MIKTLLGLARWVEELILGRRPEGGPWRWPPLEHRADVVRIDARRAGDLMRYDPDPAVCEAACEEWVGPLEEGPTLTKAEADALAEADAQVNVVQLLERADPGYSVESGGNLPWNDPRADPMADVERWRKS